MALLYGEELTKKQILEKVGSLTQIAYIRREKIECGRASSMNVYHINNGVLEFTVLIDKCMDIGSLSYKGMPMNFLARPGFMGNRWYQDGTDATRGIMGGMMFTCGLTNVGPSEMSDDGRELPKHGLIRTTPADMDGAKCFWDGDEYVMQVYGEIREASLFGNNIVIRRTIETKLGSGKVHVHDDIENECQESLPLMIMYHCNVGYPVLDKNTVFLINAEKTTGRDDIASAGMSEYDKFAAPVVGFDEQVFYHKLKSVNGYSKATIVNPDRNIGVRICFSSKELPNLIQWKCPAAGDYVMGIEPSNCYPEGLTNQKETGELRILKPLEQIKTDVYFNYDDTLTFAEDDIR